MIERILLSLLALTVAACDGVVEEDTSPLNSFEKQKLEGVSESISQALAATSHDEFIWAGRKTVPREIQGKLNQCERTANSIGPGNCPIFSNWLVTDVLENQSQVSYNLKVLSSQFMRLVPLQTVHIKGNRMTGNPSGRITLWSSLEGKVVRDNGEAFQFVTHLEAVTNSKDFKYNIQVFFENKTIDATIAPGREPEINGEKYSVTEFERLVPILY